MRVEIEIPDDWYRAPNGWGENVIWRDNPARPSYPVQLTGQGSAPAPWVADEVLKVLLPHVPLRCHSHKKTPGYIPCGNACPFDEDTTCPVPPLTKDNDQ